MLTGCGASPNYGDIAEAIKLTPIPAHLKRCGGIAHIPNKTLEDPRAIRRLFKTVRLSELRQNRCRGQAVTYYERARKRLEKATGKKHRSLSF